MREKEGEMGDTVPHPYRPSLSRISPSPPSPNKLLGGFQSLETGESSGSTHLNSVYGLLIWKEQWLFLAGRTSACRQLSKHCTTGQKVSSVGEVARVEQGRRKLQLCRCSGCGGGGGGGRVEEHHYT